MAKYVVVDADQLDADLTVVADSIRDKCGSTEKLAFPNDFKSTIDGIKTGVTVQRKSGAFATDTGGNAAVDCGFRPDLVIITGLSSAGSGVNTEFQLAFAFREAVTIYPKGIVGFISQGDYYLEVGGITQTENGFTISQMTAVGSTVDPVPVQGIQHNYVAIKYTE